MQAYTCTQYISCDQMNDSFSQQLIGLVRAWQLLWHFHHPWVEDALSTYLQPSNKPRYLLLNYRSRWRDICQLK